MFAGMKVSPFISTSNDTGVVVGVVVGGVVVGVVVGDVVVGVVVCGGVVVAGAVLQATSIGSAISSIAASSHNIDLGFIWLTFLFNSNHTKG